MANYVANIPAHKRVKGGCRGVNTQPKIEIGKSAHH